MFCRYCGAELEEGSRFCVSCGNKVEEAIASEDGYLEKTAPLQMREQQQWSQSQSPANNDSVLGQGVMVQRAGANSATAQQSGNRRSAVIVAACAAIVVIAAALIFFLVMRPQSNKESQITIQFETGGGTTIAAMQVDEGQQVTSPVDPTKDGYEFRGWYTDPSCTQNASFPFSAKEGTVLYAKWEEKKDGQNASASAGDSNSQNTAPIVIYNNTSPTPNNYTQPRQSSGYILPNSASAYLSPGDVSHLSSDDLARAMNEIWARHGRRFKNNWLQSYFNSMSWYRGTIDPDRFNSAYTPTDIENKNAELINNILSERGYDVNRAHPN